MSFSVSLAATRNAARRHYLYANRIKWHPVDRLFDTPLINCALLKPFFMTFFFSFHSFSIFLVNAFRQSASDTVTLLILKRLLAITTFLIWWRERLLKIDWTSFLDFQLVLIAKQLFMDIHRCRQAFTFHSEENSIGIKLVPDSGSSLSPLFAAKSRGLVYLTRSLTRYRHPQRNLVR